MDGQQESSENNNPPRARENNKGIDRRTFLKRSAIAGGLFASFLSGDAVLKRIAEGKDVLNDDDSSQIEDLSNEKSSISSEMLDEEQREVNQIAERLGVNLVGIREAYRLKGVPFDEKNAKEFGANLPLKWDVERARLLEELFYQLPEYFREPDGDGEPLTISLTDFGTDCECAA